MLRWRVVEERRGNRGEWERVREEVGERIAMIKMKKKD